MPSGIWNIDDIEKFLHEIEKIISNITGDPVKIHVFHHHNDIELDIDGQILDYVFFNVDSLQIFSPLLIKVFSITDTKLDIVNFIHKFNHSKSNSKREDNVREMINCLIISKNVIQDIDKLNIEYNKFDYKYNTRFFIWDRNVLCKFKNFFDKNFKSDILRSKNEFKREEKKHEHISVLNREYHRCKLVLVLGAGVSHDSNLPDWKTLVQDIYNDMLRQEIWKNTRIPIDLPIINEHGFSESSFIYADYIQDHLKDSLYTAISKHLYKNKGPKDKIFEMIWSMKNVRTIISYNYDDLLEEFNINDYNVITSGNMGKSPIKTNVYHIHGFIPNLKNGQPIKTDIIFSDDDFYRLLCEQYHWANIVQINHFRKYTCLFLGVSLQDPNIRRLLKIIHAENPNHFHYLVKRELEKNHDSKITDPSLIDFIHNFRHKLIEKSYKKMGIKIIWIDRDHYSSNIIGILKQVKRKINRTSQFA